MTYLNIWSCITRSFAWLCFARAVMRERERQWTNVCTHSTYAVTEGIDIVRHSLLHCTRIPCRDIEVEGCSTTYEYNSMQCNTAMWYSHPISSLGIPMPSNAINPIRYNTMRVIQTQANQATNTDGSCSSTVIYTRNAMQRGFRYRAMQIVVSERRTAAPGIRMLLMRDSSGSRLRWRVKRF